MKKSKKVRNVEFAPDVDHWGSLIASAIRGLVQEEISRAFDELDADWAQRLEPGAWFAEEPDGFDSELARMAAANGMTVAQYAVSRGRVTAA